VIRLESNITADVSAVSLRSGLPQSMLGLGLRRPPSLALRPLRLLHSSVPTANYVGPPDPVSNIRPVLYNDLSSRTAESPQQHPYSLDEFRNDSEDTLEYQWKLQRQQLDAFNDAFWRDVRFFHTHRAPTPPLAPREVI
jgi:Apoptogenic protein 1